MKTMPQNPMPSLSPRCLSLLLTLTVSTAIAQQAPKETNKNYNQEMDQLVDDQSTAKTTDVTLVDESLADYNQRMKWFAEAQYGMFIHFGLYSHLGGEWKGEKVPWYGEWLQAKKNIPREEYATIISEFNPEKFDAEFIARTAKEAGMKYLVITSKHHDGFCLWDSKHTEFDVASTPFKGRDILAELSKACKSHGLKFGIYYSIIDWHHPSQSPKDPTHSSPMRGWGQTVIKDGKKEEYITYQTNQLLELISNYQPDMLWFDGDWTDWWTMDDGIVLYNTLRKVSPNIIVNNRVAKRNGFELDFVTQEQKHFKEVFPKHWEGCYTMNKSWGFKKGDNEWKDAKTIYAKIKDINEKGGNLLLNIGPDGQGIVPPESVTVLKETAELLKATPIKKNNPIIETKPGIK
jgi:alpha-L-fucosidase